MVISLKVNVKHVCSDDFISSVLWALDSALLTEDEVLDLIGDEIVESIVVEEV